MSRRRMVNVLLLVGVLALFALPLILHLNTNGGTGGATYEGTDSAAAAAVEQVDPGYQPWFHPLFEPGSSEIESGLFAIQAALGAGGLGFALGRLAGRRRAKTSTQLVAASTGMTPAV